MISTRCELGSFRTERLGFRPFYSVSNIYVWTENLGSALKTEPEPTFLVPCYLEFVMEPGVSMKLPA